ncbi:class I SAM-dependent methyltransferase [Rhodoferax sp.]|uniref:class I SAM-dependent methyltransferase n=1 Tax=Rhodoferax sp. TaxID=50421 RepID=UPI0025D013D9|nr:class I SAM-dependent methyltransferase [Rhodoferax sp.]MCM2339647.1 class I SAM-dependent methyltransferase [Rhodoferax sp.]
MSEPSDWVQHWQHLIHPNARVLDVACGSGRHMAWLSQRGCNCTGIDRSAEALAQAGRFGDTVQADIEGGPWPLMQHGLPQQFDVVLVTNYLWRPLFPVLLQSLAPDGLLLYETFAQGNETVGKPARPDFLLQTGELLQLCQSLRIVAFEDGFLPNPERFVQRIAAFRPLQAFNTASSPARYPLSLK